MPGGAVLHVGFFCQRRSFFCASAKQTCTGAVILPQQMASVFRISLQKFGIIIIIIWHYNPLWVFAFSAKSLPVLLSLAVSFQFLAFSFFFRSSITSYCHRCLGLPAGLVPMDFQSSSFLVGLAWSIL